MQELTIEEIEEVSGGFILIPIAIIIDAIRSGGGGAPNGTDAMGNVW